MLNSITASEVLRDTQDGFANHNEAFKEVQRFSGPNPSGAEQEEEARRDLMIHFCETVGRRARTSLEAVARLQSRDVPVPVITEEPR